jgi:malate synthase
VRSNVSAALAYTASWIGGNGCIPLNYLMEDAATAEIARVQLWQWVRHVARLNTGQPITVAYVDALIDEISPGIKRLAPGVTDPDLRVAVQYLKGQIRLEYPGEFLTSDLMPYLAMKDGVNPKWLKTAL